MALGGLHFDCGSARVSCHPLLLFWKETGQPCGIQKTDAPQPDVKEDEEEKEEEKEKGDEEEDGEEKLEEKQKSDVEEDGDTVSQEEDDRKPKAEEDEILNRSPRNRKPRRE